MNESFGKTLRKIRKSKGISQRELARKVSVDFSYISKIENDKIPPPSADTIVKMSEALNISSEILLSLTGKMPSDIRKTMSTSATAMKFLINASDMRLTEDEWEEMSKHLKHLR